GREWTKAGEIAVVMAILLSQGRSEGSPADDFFAGSASFLRPASDPCAFVQEGRPWSGSGSPWPPAPRAGRTAGGGLRGTPPRGPRSAPPADPHASPLR